MLQGGNAMHRATMEFTAVVNHCWDSQIWFLSCTELENWQCQCQLFPCTFHWDRMHIQSGGCLALLAEQQFFELLHCVLFCAVSKWSVEKMTVIQHGLNCVFLTQKHCPTQCTRGWIQRIFEQTCLPNCIPFWIMFHNFLIFNCNSNTQKVL